jgi:hypothetical protein
MRRAASTACCSFLASSSRAPKTAIMPSPLKLDGGAAGLLHDARYALGVLVEGGEDLGGLELLGHARVAANVHEEHAHLALAGREGVAREDALGHRARHVAAQRRLDRLRLARERLRVDAGDHLGAALGHRGQQQQVACRVDVPRAPAGEAAEGHELLLEGLAVQLELAPDAGASGYLAAVPLRGTFASSADPSLGS